MGVDGRGKRESLVGHEFASPLCASIAALANGSYLDKPESKIAGSGYVLRSLEAALWCFATTGSFESAVLRAANLGDDADTTAVTGQIAGAYYGESAIPAAWLDRLVLREEIRATADRLGEAGPSA